MLPVPGGARGKGCEAVMGGGSFADCAVRAAAVACGVLGWRPAEFWGATPAELATALRGVVGDAGGDALGRGELERLRERFPDG